MSRDDGREDHALRGGSGTLKTGTDVTPLGIGTLARVGAGQGRKILPGPEGIVVLVIGATPGKAFTLR